MLFELVADLEERSIEPMLAQVKGSVRDRMRRTGLMERIGEDRLYLSMGAGVTDFLRRRGGAATPSPRGGPDDPAGVAPDAATERPPDRPGVRERLAGLLAEAYAAAARGSSVRRMHRSPRGVGARGNNGP